MSENTLLILLVLGAVGYIAAGLLIGWLLGGVAIKLWHHFTLDAEPRWIGDEHDE